MIVSLNEIETTLRKAALGVGLPLGTAEDAARGMTWAAPLPVAVETLAVEALTNIDMKRAQPPCIERHADDYRCAEARTSALWLGPVAADIARLPEPAQLSCAVVDTPFLAASIVASACHHDSSIAASVAWSAGSVRCRLVIANGAIDIQASSIADLLLRDGALDIGRDPSGIDSAAIFSSDEVQRLKASSLQSGIAVEPRAWSELCRFAARRLVPATAQSRQRGAGAGDIDRG